MAGCEVLIPDSWIQSSGTSCIQSGRFAELEVSTRKHKMDVRFAEDACIPDAGCLHGLRD